ncbi:MAG: CidA/LrgA family protein [Cetobacterium sp.]|uniref:CidA/LrgA family protein n=1 Tax=unclassified Cetobacterium TaxID=2630983 RepID=UPI000648B092|nr:MULTISPECIES: CidA/LrgA family protein [unclassified Cetobacterium]
MLYEFLIILSINYLGVILEKVFHLPTPGTVNGLILLFIFLSLKIIKLDSIKNAGDFFIVNMIITFIPPSIKLLDVVDLLKVDFFKLVLLLVLTTLITMVITALFVDFMMKGEK